MMMNVSDSSYEQKGNKKMPAASQAFVMNQ
ncbi:hypothetical protein KAI37_00649 [Paenibacillus sp. S25]|nr:hypothetical protein KAI37_00649 [Paenibacillus sp. S25]